MKEKKRINTLISEYFIFVIFIALVIVLTCLKPSFITPGNLVNILKQASINGILAFGMMFVIVAGGFDMSVGSTVAFTGILAAMLGQGDYPLIVPLIVAMLAGLALGCDGLRVGLEDNVLFGKDAEGKKIIATNVQLVERAAQLTRLAGREVATPDEAREILGITRHCLKEEY